MEKSTFIENVIQHYISQWENQFLAKFSWEGDDEFNYDAQTLFKRTIFRDGVACVYKAIENKRRVLKYWPSTTGDTNAFSGENGEIIRAVGFPAWRNYGGKFMDRASSLVQTHYSIAQFLTSEDTAFFQSQLGEDVLSVVSMEDRLRFHAEFLANLHYKFLQVNKMYGGDVVFSDNPEISNQKDKLYKIGEHMSVSINRANEDVIEDTLISKLDSSVSLLDFKGDPQVMIDTIEKYKARVDKMFGFRTNQHFKKERLINAEMENNENEFKSADFRLYEALENWTNRYNKVFETNLVLVENIISDNKKVDNEPANNVNEDMQVDDKGDSNGS